MSKVILGGESVRASDKRSPRDATVLIAPLTAFGLVLCGVAIVDLGMLWFPLRFGFGEWEFGNASRTFDSLAIVTTGMVFLTLAAAIGNSTRWLRLLSVLSLLGLIALVGILIVYMLNVPLALRFMRVGTQPVMRTAILRTSLFATMYIVFYAWLTWFTWRRAGAARRGGPA